MTAILVTTTITPTEARRCAFDISRDRTIGLYIQRVRPARLRGNRGRSSRSVDTRGKGKGEEVAGRWRREEAVMWSRRTSLHLPPPHLFVSGTLLVRTKKNVFADQKKAMSPTHRAYDPYARNNKPGCHSVGRVSLEIQRCFGVVY